MRREITLVGITGGIGSGKSTVCALLKDLGRTVLHADDIARECTQSSPAILRQIREKFGGDVFDRNGLPDRKALAEIVFASKTRLRQLNAIVHPEVYREVEVRLDGLGPAQTRPYVAIEAALIFESGLDRTLRAVVVVDAPRDVRISRSVRRSGLTPEAIEKRMASQIDPEVARERADIVIDNSGDIESLRTKVSFVDGILSRLPVL